MDYAELINSIFQVCIIPLLGVLTTFLVTFIRKKSAEIQTKTDNELADKYVAMLENTITNCVIATNQTYVEALKKEGKFDASAQKTAFNMTSTAVLQILSEEAKVYLTNVFGDLQTFVNQQIEAAVNKNKITVA